MKSSKSKNQSVPEVRSPVNNSVSSNTPDATTRRFDDLKAQDYKQDIGLRKDFSRATFGLGRRMADCSSCFAGLFFLFVLRIVCFDSID